MTATAGEGTEPYRCVPDPRCQRGLRFNYHFDAGLNAEALCRAIDALDVPWVANVERWGPRTIERRVWQFRVELRIGERVDQVGVLYRSCCPEETRAEVRDLLESVFRGPALATSAG